MSDLPGMSLPFPFLLQDPDSVDLVLKLILCFLETNRKIR
jgi:hypothetical protein